MNSYAQLMFIVSGILFVSGITFYDEDAEYRQADRTHRKNPKSYIAAMRKTFISFSAATLASGIISLCGSSPRYETLSFIVLVLGILAFFTAVIIINIKHKR